MNYRNVILASIAATAIVAAALTPTRARAQSIALHPAGDRLVSFEYVHPLFPDGTAKIYAGALFVDVRSKVGKVIVLGELPVALVPYDGGSANMIGNAYIGVEMPVRGLALELGTRLPTSSGDRDAGFFVSAVDLDRLEAFRDESVTLRAMLHNKPRDDGFTLVWHAGAVKVLSSNEFAVDWTYAAYGLEMQKRGARASSGLGLVGRTALNSDAGNIGERSLMMLNGWIELGKGSVRPVLIGRLPIDSDLRGFINGVIGVQLNVFF